MVVLDVELDEDDVDDEVDDGAVVELPGPPGRLRVVSVGSVAGGPPGWGCGTPVVVVVPPPNISSRRVPACRTSSRAPR